MTRRSPFPGMDPYLESRWSDVHVKLIGFMGEAIQPLLPSDLGWEPDVWRAYPTPLRERLPSIPIPLRKNEREVVLELQPLIDRVYVAGGHDDNGIEPSRLAGELRLIETNGTADYADCADKKAHLSAASEASHLLVNVR